jgi:hypothetical protein
MFTPTARFSRNVLIGSCILAGAASAEVIGPYRVIDAPITAELLGGGGGAFTWLNVVNAPTSIQDAFTGVSIVADGYANANAGTTIRLTYRPGALRNDPGPDLVLFDAGASPSDFYRIASNYNNFASEMLLLPNVNTGEQRSYFYGGSGPASYDVMAGTIDLSQLGVPSGAAVTQLRVFTEGGSCDLLGVGVLLPACPADIDGDASVGLGDLAQLLVAFGSSPTDPSWNPRADIDADGAVTLADLSLLLTLFGSACP